MTDQELLLFALKNNMLDIGTIRHNVEMNERKKLLEKHNNKIWQGINGKWYTELPLPGGKRKLVKKSKKEALEDAICEHYRNGSDEDHLTLNQVFDMWLEKKLERNEIGRATYDRYKGDFVRFFKGTEMWGARMDLITEKALEDFIKQRIADKKLTAKAYGNMKTLIIGTFKHGKKIGATNISVYQFFGDLDIGRKAFERPQKKKQVFTDKEVEKIAEYCNSNPSIYTLGILLAFQTGLREGELAALRFDDVNDGLLHVSRQEIRYKEAPGKMNHKIVDYTKTQAGDREVILTDKAQETIERIRELNPNSDYMMMVGSRRLHKQLFTDWIYKICKAVDIERRSMHKARKTYGSMLIDAGVDISLVSEQLGHEEVATTIKSYYYNTKEEEHKRQQIQSAMCV